MFVRPSKAFGAIGTRIYPNKNQQQKPTKLEGKW